jgi:hypothetical protein
MSVTTAWGKKPSVASLTATRSVAVPAAGCAPAATGAQAQAQDHDEESAETAHDAALIGFRVCGTHR